VIGPKTDARDGDLLPVTLTKAIHFQHGKGVYH
jgi:hypothetical protein